MDKLLNKIRFLLEEASCGAGQDTLEYKRCRKEVERLWDEIAADLGQDGDDRLSGLAHAQAAEESFWQYAMFCRALALGITLGRLSVQSSPS